MNLTKEQEDRLNQFPSSLTSRLYERGARELGQDKGETFVVSSYLRCLEKPSLE